jgi:hypothetical protein
MSANTKLRSLDEVLTAFHMESDRPSPKILERYCRSYPQFVHEITEFAIEWAKLNSPLEQTIAETPVNKVLLSKTESQFQSLLYELDKERRDGSDNHSALSDPFASLDADEFERVASTIGVDVPLLAKIVYRQIRDIPTKLVQRLAELLYRQKDELDRYFSLAASAPMEKSFKARDKPIVVSKESFDSAVRSSNLTEDQKALLLRDYS